MSVYELLSKLLVKLLFTFEMLEILGSYSTSSFNDLIELS